MPLADYLVSNGQAWNHIHTITLNKLSHLYLCKTVRIEVKESMYLRGSLVGEKGVMGGRNGERATILLDIWKTKKCLNYRKKPLRLHWQVIPWHSRDSYTLICRQKIAKPPFILHENKYSIFQRIKKEQLSDWEKWNTVVCRDKKRSNFVTYKTMTDILSFH